MVTGEPAITEAIPSPHVTTTAHPTREAWLQARVLGIGSSESAAVLGISPWVSRFQLWAEKRGLVQRPETTSAPAYWGLRLEDTVADEYTRVTGRRLVNLGAYTICRSIERPFMFATHDRVIQAIDERGPGILSIKTADKSKAELWAPPHGAPLDYQVQLQHELAVTGYLWGSFAVLIGGNDFRWLDVERNAEFIDQLESECFRFWQEVETGTEPEVDASKQTAETLRRLYPADDGNTVYLPDESASWDQEREEAIAMIRDGEHRKQLAENKIAAALGAATYAVLPNGTRYTFKTKTRKGYTRTVAPASWRELHRQEGKSE